jgi:hypothetical protein
MKQIRGIEHGCQGFRQEMVKKNKWKYLQALRQAFFSEFENERERER